MHTGIHAKFSFLFEKVKKFVQYFITEIPHLHVIDGHAVYFHTSFQSANIRKNLQNDFIDDVPYLYV